MRPVVMFMLFFLLGLLSVQAQQKIYYTLGAKFKYLRQDQITITPLHEITKASFVYQQRQYQAFFDRDSSLVELLIIQDKSACPAEILSDMNCIYREYKLARYQLREYYVAGLMTDKQTEVIVQVFGSFPSYEQWEYEDGERALNPIWVELQDGDYIAKDMLMAGGRRKDGANWYGGSFEAFKDSIAKYIQVNDMDCLKRFSNKSLSVFIWVNQKGAITYSGFEVTVPYLLEERMKQFFNRIVFPPVSDDDSDILYRYQFNMYWSVEKGLQVVP